MRLRGHFFEQLRDALLDAFDYGNLRSMVRIELEVNLDEIVIQKGTLRDQIEDLISWAEEQDRVENLIAVARNTNPGNKKLEAVEGVFLDLSQVVDLAGQIAFIHYFKNKKQRIYYFESDEVILGREARSQIGIGLASDTKISRRHARVFRHIGTWWVEDLDSTNGTKLNNATVNEHTELVSGDQLALGDTLLLVKFEDEKADLQQGTIEDRLAVEETRAYHSSTQNLDLDVLERFGEISMRYSGQTLLDKYLRELFILYPQGERCTIVLIEGTELIASAYGPGAQAKVSYSLAREAIESREAFRWTRAFDFSSSQKWFSSLNDVSSAIYAPLICNNHVIGVLHVDSTKTDVVFSENNVALLSFLANTMAPAIMLSRVTSFSRLHNIFVSYADEDRDETERLARHLRKRGIKVWFNERIQFGDNRQDKIRGAIRATDALILLVPMSDSSTEQLIDEISNAQSSRKRLIPIVRQRKKINKRLMMEIGHLEPLILDEETYDSDLDQLAEVIKSTPFAAQDASLRRLRVLYLATNPTHAFWLRTDKSYRRIREKLESTKTGDSFKIETELAKDLSNISSALLYHKPDIVHFSGNIDDEGNLDLMDEMGINHQIPATALRDLIGEHSNDVRCVVLNECRSDVLVKAMLQEVDYVIRMSQPISDKAAVAFASGFYQALGYESDLSHAFDAGCAEINLTVPDQKEIPQLIRRGGTDAGAKAFSEEVKQA